MPLKLIFFQCKVEAKYLATQVSSRTDRNFLETRLALATNKLSQFTGRLATILMKLDPLFSTLQVAHKRLARTLLTLDLVPALPKTLKELKWLATLPKAQSPGLTVQLTRFVTSACLVTLASFLVSKLRMFSRQRTQMQPMPVSTKEFLAVTTNNQCVIRPLLVKSSHLPRSDVSKKMTNTIANVIISNTPWNWIVSSGMLVKASLPHHAVKAKAISTHVKSSNIKTRAALRCLL